jgi:YfiH family protein
MIIIEDKILNGSIGKIQHGFFGRQGGVSQGTYESLNCGPGSDDDPRAVQENRARVAKHFGVGADKLASVWQIHSPDCLIIDQIPPSGDKRPKADAMVTDKAGLILGVLTADCGPILFAGEKADGSPVIGAAHAGWGGALKGVLESTLEKMKECGATDGSLRAAIGPCIGPASYEVSQGYEKPFLERDPEDERFFRAARQEGHLMFDLPGYIANRLAQAGVTQVTITGHDTYALAEEFFSYRRATHNNDPDYGRQISAIFIKP